MNTVIDPVLAFEQLKLGDETDYSLRSYVARIPEEKLVRYDPSWSDEQLIAWDGNFRSDGSLMLVCCERDVEPEDFRAVLEEFLEWRKKN